jgi:hypothetical protein
MTDLTQILSGLIDELTPIHETEAAFAKGGRECARAIERIYRALVEVEPAVSELEDEVDALKRELAELEPSEEELAAFAAALAEDTP